MPSYFSQPHKSPIYAVILFSGFLLKSSHILPTSFSHPPTKAISSLVFSVSCWQLFPPSSLPSLVSSEAGEVAEKGKGRTSEVNRWRGQHAAWKNDVWAQWGGRALSRAPCCSGNRRGRTMKLGKGERIQVLDSETQLRLRKCRCQKFVWVGCLPYSLFSSHTCASFTVLCLHPEKAVHFLLASLTSYVEVVVWLFLLNLLLSGLKTRLLFSVHFFFCW